MTEDRDLMAALPDPPPPRPDRRTMAIDEALHRFDGHEAGQSTPQHTTPGISFRTIFARPQVAAFATVVLVGLLSLPLWLSDAGQVMRERRQPSTVAAESGEASELEVAPEREPPALAANEAPSRDELAPAPPPAEQLADSSDGTAMVEKAEPRAAEAQLNRLPAFEPAAEEQPAARQQFALAPPPPPPPPAPPAKAARDESMAIVVTGARAAPQRASAALADRERIAEAAAEKAGDWNACTIDDPRQDLRACDELADLAEPGSAGRANAHLADGLRFAWQGDLDRAIDAFDSAIEIVPDLSLAYLNRGLAHWRKGDTGRALDDLDEAIVNDPDAARGYYHRSRLYRERGANARASADARRAIRLDPSYEAVLP